MQEKNHYLQSFARFERRAAGNGPRWLHSIRQAAIERFAELGFPTTKDEDWKFTDLTPLTRSLFKFPEDGRVTPTSLQLESFGLSGSVSNRLVFVNGRYSAKFSVVHPVGARPEVKVTRLGEALASEPGLVEEYLARQADYRQDAFTALNTAFMEEGAVISIPKGVVLEAPIQVLYVSMATKEPMIIQPRNLIVMGENSQASVVEHYVSLNGGVYFTNAVTEAVVGENSVLSHYRIEQESRQAFNISTLRVQQHRSSSVSCHAFLMGGSLVRNNVHPVLAGEGCDCLINGLWTSNGQQHIDNYMRVEHLSPHGTSRQLYKGILDGQSRGVFHGRIVVHKAAQKTDAKQTNRNLLLSDDAQIDTKPQLEIYADDVKCTHAATIGQIDEEALFYLRSRGIDAESAQAVLLLAFASESLERMKEEPVRRYLEELVRQWLPQGSLF